MKSKKIEIRIDYEPTADIIGYAHELLTMKRGMFLEYKNSLKEFYKINRSNLVQDRDVIDDLQDLIDNISARWSGLFAKRSFSLAKRAVLAAKYASERQFKGIYRKYPNLILPKPETSTPQSENEFIQFSENLKSAFSLEEKGSKLVKPPKINFKEPFDIEHNTPYAKNPFIIQPNLKEEKAKTRIIQAGIAQNVGLIKSIPKQFHEQILESVMRNVAVGGNAFELVNDLSKISDRSSKRIKLIANDQIAKATALLDQQAAINAGFTHAKWKKSIAGKTHRESHAEANNKEFDIRKGCLIEGEYILPRMKINCKCSYDLIIKVTKI